MRALKGAEHVQLYTDAQAHQRRLLLHGWLQTCRVKEKEEQKEEIPPMQQVRSRSKKRKKGLHASAPSWAHHCCILLSILCARPFSWQVANKEG